MADARPNERILALLEDVVTTTCDDLFTGPSLITANSLPKGCSHSLAEHGVEGCNGTWYHSRCASDHDCDCEISRDMLMAKLLEGLLKRHTPVCSACEDEQCRQIPQSAWPDKGHHMYYSESRCQRAVVVTIGNTRWSTSCECSIVPLWAS